LLRINGYPYPTRYPIFLLVLRCSFHWSVFSPVSHNQTEATTSHSFGYDRQKVITDLSEICAGQTAEGETIFSFVAPECAQRQPRNTEPTVPQPITASGLKAGRLSLARSIVRE
jgi:hypothetical protein